MAASQLDFHHFQTKTLVEAFTDQHAYVRENKKKQAKLLWSAFQNSKKNAIYSGATYFEKPDK